MWKLVEEIYLNDPTSESEPVNVFENFKCDSFNGQTNALEKDIDRSNEISLYKIV